MIPDDAFLRRLPTLLDATQVVQLEALVFAADAVGASLDIIRQITTHYREKLGEAGRPVTLTLFIHAWTIVDSVHIVRQVLTAIDYKTPRALEFQKKYDCARVLRNKMDHLAENARNVGSSKGRPPVFGVLTYICLPDDKVIQQDGKVTVTGGMTAVVTTGRFITAGGRFTILNPAGLQFNGPVGGFRLDAFGELLELEEVERDLRALMAEVNGRLQDQALATATNISNERQIPIERLMANPPGGVIFFLPFNIDQ
jgi:hypothetical protein